MRRAFGGRLRCLQSQNKARKLHCATNGELRPCVEDLSRQVHELASQGERHEVTESLDRDFITVRDPQHERLRRLPKLPHSHDRRVVSRDTVSRKGRLGTFSDVC